jgi:peptide/nickel transport system permease protein
MREALGLSEPTYIRFGKWLWQFFVVEPMHLIDLPSAPPSPKASSA